MYLYLCYFIRMKHWIFVTQYRVMSRILMYLILYRRPLRIDWILRAASLFFFLIYFCFTLKMKSHSFTISSFDLLPFLRKSFLTDLVMSMPQSCLAQLKSSFVRCSFLSFSLRLKIEFSIVESLFISIAGRRELESSWWS